MVSSAGISNCISDPTAIFVTACSGTEKRTISVEISCNVIIPSPGRISLPAARFFSSTTPSKGAHMRQSSRFLEVVTTVCSALAKSVCICIHLTSEMPPSAYTFCMRSAASCACRSVANAASYIARACVSSIVARHCPRLTRCPFCTYTPVRVPPNGKVSSTV